MKKILIISPHYPPSNLAAVHRSRLFAQHLPAFGWEPIILTVDEDCYEESLDRNLEQLLPEGQRIEKVKAFPVTKPRLIGDIGLRSFFQLYNKAKSLIKNEGINFLYIPIPSFYVALLGRWLHKTTGVKYGIDYIDPWVHVFPGSQKVFSRHWFSTKIAKYFEPIAVKHASLITGVSEGYYQGVKDRNPHLLKTCLFGAMPYGGEGEDHLAVNRLKLKPYLFVKNGKLQLVYAGAMLPKAYILLERIFQSIAENKEAFKRVEFHFIGTGKTPNDPEGFNIKPIAQQYGLWEKVIFEYPKRIPYLDVLTHLEAASGVFILGSTEPHYTPSKVYQAVLSKKPIFALLHSKSTAVPVIRNSNTGIVLCFEGEGDLNRIDKYFVETYKNYLTYINDYAVNKIRIDDFDQFSAKSVTNQLVSLLNQIIPT